MARSGFTSFLPGLRVHSGYQESERRPFFPGTEGLPGSRTLYGPATNFKQTRACKRLATCISSQQECRECSNQVRVKRFGVGQKQANVDMSASISHWLGDCPQMVRRCTQKTLGVLSFPSRAGCRVVIDRFSKQCIHMMASTHWKRRSALA